MAYCWIKITLTEGQKVYLDRDHKNLLPEMVNELYGSELAEDANTSGEKKQRIYTLAHDYFSQISDAAANGMETTVLIEKFSHCKTCGSFPKEMPMNFCTECGTPVTAQESFLFQ